MLKLVHQTIKIIPPKIGKKLKSMNFMMLGIFRLGLQKWKHSRIRLISTIDNEKRNLIIFYSQKFSF